MSIVPEELAEFISRAPWLDLTSRDARLRTTIRRCFGAVVADDRERITTFVPVVRAEKLRQDLLDNGRVSFIVAKSTENHRTHQLKGRFLEWRAATPDEEAIAQAGCAKVAQELEALGMSPKIFDTLIALPCVAVAFRVEEIFDQTPGPRAGTRLHPR
jgi:hypothetical protein